MRNPILLLVLILTAGPRSSGNTRLSSGFGEAQLSFNFARNIAVGQSGDVHVVWFDSQIHYRRSVDDGRTWALSTMLSSGLQSEHPAIAVAGDSVYVVWHEVRAISAPVTPVIVFRRSSDRGATWEPAQHLTDPAIHSAHPSIAATGTSVHVTWFDGRHGEMLPEIYTRHSLDGGASWRPEHRISESNAASWVSTIEADGLNVFVGWVDYLDANEEEYLRRSVDGGETWLPAVRMTNDPADSWAPSMAVSDSTVHFAWFDRRDAGVTDADIERKINEALILVGVPASPPPPRTPAKYYLFGFPERIQMKKQQLSEAAPRWVAGGGDPKKIEAILLQYEQLEQQWSQSWEIYYKRSTDRGQSFSDDRRLTFAAGPSSRPSVAARGDDVAVFWFDSRGQGFDIYAKFSQDDGITWSEDVRLTSSGAAVLPSAARSREAIHVIWRDSSPGSSQIDYLRIPATPRRRAVR